MNRIKYFICLTSILEVFQAQILFSQPNSWINTGGPYRGNAISLATGSGGVMFALTVTGIYRSMDYGQTWGIVNHDPRIPHSTVSSFYYQFSAQQILLGKNGSVFLKTDDSLLFRSTDQGDTWISLESGLSNKPVRSLVSSTAGNLFALVDSMGILWSSSNGDQWAPMYFNIPISHIYSLAVDSTRLMIMSTDTCYYLSTDQGGTWSPSVGANGNLLAISPNRTIFTATAISGFRQIGPYSNVGIVFRSTDSGSHWTACYSITSARGFANLPRLDELAVSSDGNVLFTTTDGVYRSTDNGDSWTEIFWDKLNLVDQSSCLSPDFKNNLYIGTNKCGIIQLAGRDTFFNFIAPTFLSQPVNDVGTNKSGVFVTLASGVYRSTDNGQDWKGVFIPPTSISKVLESKVNSQGTIFVINDFNHSGMSGMYRSTDNGDHWDTLPELDCRVLEISPTDMILQGTPYGGAPIYRSTDNGNSWTKVDSLDGNAISAFCFAFNAKNQIFAGAKLRSWGELWRSLDSGKTWAYLNNGLPTGPQSIFASLVNRFGDYGVNVIGINKTGIIFASTDSGFYRSTNNGESWKEIDQTLPLTLITYLSSSSGPPKPLFGLPEVYSITFNSLDRVYIAYNRGVYYSTDDGDTWIPYVTDENKNHGMKSLAFDAEGYLYGGDFSGTIYRSQFSTTSVHELRKIVPQRWELSQNYPNPFNPTTNILFSIPSQSFVTLKVYDLLGREVTTIVSEQLLAGSYRRQWNAEGFPSGIYFYRLQSASLSETKKLLVIK
jgi:photosystem II stability/assembly factor-like uncharacterized protein